MENFKPSLEKLEGVRFLLTGSSGNKLSVRLIDNKINLTDSYGISCINIDARDMAAAMAAAVNVDKGLSCFCLKHGTFFYPQKNKKAIVGCSFCKSEEVSKIIEETEEDNDE